MIRARVYRGGPMRHGFGKCGPRGCGARGPPHHALIPSLSFEARKRCTIMVVEAARYGSASPSCAAARRNQKLPQGEIPLKLQALHAHGARVSAIRQV